MTTLSCLGFTARQKSRRRARRRGLGPGGPKHFATASTEGATPPLNNYESGSTTEEPAATRSTSMGRVFRKCNPKPLREGDDWHCGREEENPGEETPREAVPRAEEKVTRVQES